MELSDAGRLFALSAVVMGLSHTIAKERIFYALRKRLGGMETWLGYLVSCPYCVSHWLAFALVPLMGLYPIQVGVEWGIASDVLDWFFSSILVTVIAAFFRVGFYFVDESQGLIKRRQKAVEEETALLESQLPDDAKPPALH